MELQRDGNEVIFMQYFGYAKKRWDMAVTQAMEWHGIKRSDVENMDIFYGDSLYRELVFPLALQLFTEMEKL
jgi:hypothetical protein